MGGKLEAKNYVRPIAGTADLSWEVARLGTGPRHLTRRRVEEEIQEGGLEGGW